MDKEKWKSIMLPRMIVEQLETFSESQIIKNLGFTNKSQIATSAIREFLRRYSVSIAQFDFLDSSEDNIILFDYSIGSKINIIIDKKRKIITCVNDNSMYCDHVQFVFELPRLQEILKSYNTNSAKPKKRTDENIMEWILQLKTPKPGVTNWKEVADERFIKILKEVIKKIEEN